MMTFKVIAFVAGFTLAAVSAAAASPCGPNVDIADCQTINVPMAPHTKMVLCWSRADGMSEPLSAKAHDYGFHWVDRSEIDRRCAP